MTKKETETYKCGEHVMNKAEGAIMRRIQSETGLSKEEVRTHKKYRKMLSDAQNSHINKQTITLRWRDSNHIKETLDWGSPKTMFMQKACQILKGDKELATRLYKRYSGGLVDDKRPNAFYYREISIKQDETTILKAIDKTDGMFVFAPHRNEVGFAYETSLTMFSLLYTP